MILEQEEDSRINEYQLCRRRGIGVITTTSTNHGAFPSYFRHVNVKNAPRSCPLCREEEADGIHYLTSGSKLDGQRERICLRLKIETDFKTYVGSTERRKALAKVDEEHWELFHLVV